MSQITGGGLGNPAIIDVETLTGNAGGAVGADAAANINTLGAALIAVTGNPGTNTLTWSLVNGNNGQLIIGGGANPAWADLTSAGGTITITPGANTLNIDTAAIIATQYNEDAGSAVPALGILNINSAVGTAVNDATFRNLRTSGAGNTVSISLNNSISLPNTNAAQTEGVYSLGNDRFLHNFGTDNTFTGREAGNLTLTGIDNVGCGAFSLSSLTSGNSNTAAGSGSLLANTSGGANSMFGYLSGEFITTGMRNSGFGVSALNGLVSGADNTGIGWDSLLQTTGDQNTALGSRSGLNISSGDVNLLLGYDSGSNYTTESNNITLSNTGTVADSGTIRIGTVGTHVNSFFSGIYQVTPSGATETVIVDASGELGSVSSGIEILTYTLVNTTPYAVLATDQFLGVDSSGGIRTIQLPNAPATGRTFTIKDITGSADTNNITVTTVGGVVLIDALATYTMNTEYSAINVLFSGTQYYIF